MHSATRCRALANGRLDSTLCNTFFKPASQCCCADRLVVDQTGLSMPFGHPWCDALGCLRLDSPPGAAHQSAGQPAPMGVSAGCFAYAGRGRHSVDPRVTVKMKLVTAKTQLRVVMVGL